MNWRTCRPFLFRYLVTRSGRRVVVRYRLLSYVRRSDCEVH